MPVARRLLLLGAQKPDAIYVGQSVFSGSASTNIDFGSFNVGSGRCVKAVILAYASGASNFGISSATIGGAAATLDVAPTASSFAQAIVGVPASGPVNISVVLTQTTTTAVCFVYQLRAVRSISPYGQNTQSTQASGTSYSFSVPTAAGGVLIVGHLHSNTSGGLVWTGVTQDDVASTGVFRGAVARSVPTKDETAAVSVSWSTSGGRGIIGASYR